MESFIRGLPTAALEDAERELGLASKLIMCFLRHLSAEAEAAFLDEPAKQKLIEELDGYMKDADQ